MAVSVESLFQERKYPFIFTLLILLICVIILLFTNNTTNSTVNPLVYYSEIKAEPRPPSPVASPNPKEQGLPGNESLIVASKDQKSPLKEESLDNVPVDLGNASLIVPSKDQKLPLKGESFDNVPVDFGIESLIVPSKDQNLPLKQESFDNVRGDLGNESLIVSSKDQKLPLKEESFDNLPVDLDINWKLCKGQAAVDYIPCLDNFAAIKALKSRRHMEHRERHCPDPTPHCLVPFPKGYKVPVPWPKSRDMIWYDNVPHPKLVDYKKDQHWVVKSGAYFVFPGGGTQFKDGVNHYIDFIQKTLPTIQWGKNIRVVLDVGCGVASFGGYLLDKNVITMSLAPKDEHEAQIQFALERGIPATLSVIGTRKLTFPDNGFDLIHCARCRVHWDADGGKPLYELNRILRPGGYFTWSATPVYRDDERDKKVWNAMVTITKAMCWTVMAKTLDSSGIGLVIYQKPISSSCYEKREVSNPPICEQKDGKNSSWYARLSSCLSPLPVDGSGNLQSWPMPWPQRLTSKPPSLPTDSNANEMFYEDSKRWAKLVSDVYVDGLSINWSSVRNVMDMNAGYGGFATALIDLPVWVMNVVPIDVPDTLAVIFDRGLIGMYHDWCESFNTYPRTYDLLHSSFLFKYLEQRCDIVDVVVELDRILRPDGYLLVQDTIEVIRKLGPILRSLHWSVTLYQNQYLVGRKSFWRPTAVEQ